jgi:hypothetical protein
MSLEDIKENIGNYLKIQINNYDDFRILINLCFKNKVEKLDVNIGVTTIWVMGGIECSDSIGDPYCEDTKENVKQLKKRGYKIPELMKIFKLYREIENNIYENFGDVGIEQFYYLIENNLTSSKK